MRGKWVYVVKEKSNPFHLLKNRTALYLTYIDLLGMMNIQQLHIPQI